MIKLALRKTRSATIRLKRYIISSRFGASPDTIYQDDFYDFGGFHKTEYTAQNIVGFLYEKYAPASVLDLGCGTGNYLAHFASSGCSTLGIEGAKAAISRVPEAVLAIHYDLRNKLCVNQRFDLVMSVEVAEHIPKRFSKNLVDSLCEHARNTIVFTAAPPGTPGNDHVNCQDRPFWDQLFEQHDFHYSEDETRSLRSYAKHHDVNQWFQDWSFIYRRGPLGDSNPLN